MRKVLSAEKFVIDQIDQTDEIDQTNQTDHP
jgi:hypothetical protein